MELWPCADLGGQDVLRPEPLISTMSLNTPDMVDPESAKRRLQLLPSSPAPRHQCRFCPYASRHRGSLVLHERVHTGERPFRCHLCSRGFAHRSHVVRHLRTHTGERPFRCPLCPAAFSQRSNVKVHLRSHVVQRHNGGTAAAAPLAQAGVDSDGSALQM